MPNIGTQKSRVNRQREETPVYRLLLFCKRTEAHTSQGNTKSDAGLIVRALAKHIVSAYGQDQGAKNTLIRIAYSFTFQLIVFPVCDRSDNLNRVAL
jgi:hypothetical protein